MAEHDQEQKLEELLDSMLATYSAAEPRPGMETRIVANLRAQGGQNERSWSRLWLWAGAAVAAAVAVLAFVALHRPSGRSDRAPEAIVNRTPQAAPETPRQGSPKRESAAVVTPSRHQSSPHQAMPEQVADTRPDVFPTPAPLSEQEKLLLRYLAGTPRAEIVAQSHADEPPQDGLPQDQTALPGSAVNNSQSSNTR
jgi:hypothetical protein